MKHSRKKGLQRDERDARPHATGPGVFRDASGALSLDRSTVVRRWSESFPGLGFLTFFAMVWNCGVTAFFLMTWNGPLMVNHDHYGSLQHALASNPTSWFVFLFPLVGLGMVYVALAGWFNTTTITVDERSIACRRGPMPWRAMRVTIPRANVVQAYVRVYVSHRQNRRAVEAFRVQLQMRAGPEVTLDRGIAAYGDARRLEQWLEARLGVIDVPVPVEAQPR